MRGDRQRDVVLDVRPLAALRLADVFAQRPQPRRPAPRDCAMRRVDDRARFHRRRERVFHCAASGESAARVVRLQQHVPRVIRAAGRAASGWCLRDSSQREAADQLEPDEPIAERSLHCTQQRRRRCPTSGNAASAVTRVRGAAKELQHRRGDDAERAFAADEQLLEVVAGIVLAQAAQPVPVRVRRRARLRRRARGRARCRSAARRCRRRSSKDCRRSCSCLRSRATAETASSASAAACCTSASVTPASTVIVALSGSTARTRAAGRATARLRVRTRRASRAPHMPVLPPCGTIGTCGVGAQRDDGRDLGGARRAHDAHAPAVIAAAPVDEVQARSPAARQARGRGRRSFDRRSMKVASCSAMAHDSSAPCEHRPRIRGASARHNGGAMSDQSSKPENETAPFSAQDAMAFMQRMWNPFSMLMPGSSAGGVTPTDPPGNAEPAGGGRSKCRCGFLDARDDGQHDARHASVPEPRSDVRRAESRGSERKIGELRVIEGWLSMSLNLTQMSIKTMELQLASLEALHAAHSPARAKGESKPRKG